MCYNKVVFSGDEAAVENVRAFFKDLQEKEAQNIMPWEVTPLIGNHGYLDNVWQKEGAVHFRSRWVPKLEMLVEIAIQYGVNFTNNYREPGMRLFGEASYGKGAYTDTRLDGRDFQAIVYNEQTGVFHFEGKTYNDDWPIMEQLLERKKARDLNFNTTSDITKEQLLQLYDELLPADFVLKFAEHKNFDGARKAFFALDAGTITRLGDYIANNDWNKPEKYLTHDKYIAMNFLQKLVTEWDYQRQCHDNQTDGAYKYWHL